MKGKKVIVPIANRVVPIIEDEYVDMEFGTGFLKVTPAHDVNDYMLGEKYNLEVIDIFNDNGTLNSHGLQYEGMGRFDVRKKIEKDLEMCIRDRGRVWTGNQALKIGLVDALGNIDTAIQEAAKLAKLDDYSLQDYPKKVDFLESLLSNQKEEFATKAMKEYLGKDYELFKTIKEIKEQDFVQARMPYDISIR